MLRKLDKQAARPGVDMKSPDDQPVPIDLNKTDHAAFHADRPVNPRPLCNYDADYFPPDQQLTVSI